MRRSNDLFRKIGGPSDDIAEHETLINALIAHLTNDVSVDPLERTAEQQARWILAHLLDWHRREEKAGWWEYFRLSASTSDELLDEKAALGGLTFMGTVERSPKGIPTDRYEFIPQDTEIRDDADLRMAGGEKFGSVTAISKDNRTVDIKKSAKTAAVHAQAVFEHTHIPTKEQQGAVSPTATSL